MAEEGQVNEVIVIKSVESFNEQLQKGKDANKLIVVDFTASWCGPCRFIAPVFAEIAKKTSDAIFLKVDVDDVRPIAEKYSIEAMPTFLFLKEEKEVDKVVGADRAQLELKITQHKADSAVPAAPAVPAA